MNTKTTLAILGIAVGAIILAWGVGAWQAVEPIRALETEEVPAVTEPPRDWRNDPDYVIIQGEPAHKHQEVTEQDEDDERLTIEEAHEALESFVGPDWPEHIEPNRHNFGRTMRFWVAKGSDLSVAQARELLNADSPIWGDIYPEHDYVLSQAPVFEDVAETVKLSELGIIVHESDWDSLWDLPGTPMMFENICTLQLLRTALFNAEADTTEVEEAQDYYMRRLVANMVHLSGSSDLEFLHHLTTLYREDRNRR